MCGRGGFADLFIYRSIYVTQVNSSRKGKTGKESGSFGSHGAIPSINLSAGTGTSNVPGSVTGLSMAELNGGSSHVTPGMERMVESDAGRPAKRARIG